MLKHRPLPVRPNVGVSIAYQCALEHAIRVMADEVEREIGLAYGDRPRLLATDESITAELQRLIRRLSRRWQRRFDGLADEMAGRFARGALGGNDAAFMASLRSAGFTVRFQATPAMNEALRAVIGENVALIRSIPAEYLSSVEGTVMRNVQTGRDLFTMTNELRADHAIPLKRATIIARDQANKATAVFTRVRQLGLGITKARWLHSRGGRVPRPEHVAFSGKLYDVATGAYLEGKWVWPGTEINCRCVSIPYFPVLEN